MLSAGGMGQGGMGQGGWGRGGDQGGGGRGHFIHLAMYCTTTWCFALKGLRTTKGAVMVSVGPPLEVGVNSLSHEVPSLRVWPDQPRDCVLCSVNNCSGSHLLRYAKTHKNFIQLGGISNNASPVGAEFRIFKRVVARRAVYHTINVIILLII